MSLAIFKDVTTEEVLTQYEERADEYRGLYVDMWDKEQRKYVKGQASTIKDMLKVLDRARIDKVKHYKLTVEDEAARIRTRLEAANEPFTILIDEWEADRKAKLAEEKARKDAEELAIQKEIDHETALMMDKVYLIEKKEREEAQAAHEQAIREQAIADAEIRQAQAVEQAKADALAEVEAKRLRAEQEQKAREADTAHKTAINREILTAILTTGVTEQQAKAIICMAAKGEAGNMKVYY